jgi:hypothetical protein
VLLADVDAAVVALERLASDERLRNDLIRAGLEHVEHETEEAQLDRVSEFLHGQSTS